MKHAFQLVPPHLLQLWIQRINAACRSHGTPYSHFISGLVKQNVCLNRKVLSQLAIHEPQSFKVRVFTNNLSRRGLFSR
jgi:ribosomal protein L20